jgi:hypothetical protein
MKAVMRRLIAILTSGELARIRATSFDGKAAKPLAPRAVVSLPSTLSVEPWLYEFPIAHVTN